MLDTSTYNALMLAYARDSATAAEDGLDQSMGEPYSLNHRSLPPTPWSLTPEPYTLNRRP